MKPLLGSSLWLWGNILIWEIQNVFHIFHLWYNLRYDVRYNDLILYWLANWEIQIFHYLDLRSCNCHRWTKNLASFAALPFRDQVSAMKVEWQLFRWFTMFLTHKHIFLKRINQSVLQLFQKVLLLEESWSELFLLCSIQVYLISFIWTSKK